MLTSSGRVAARRVIQGNKASIPTAVPSSTLRVFAPRVILYPGSLTARRSFAISVCLRHPAAKSVLTKRTKPTSKAKKTTKTAAKKKPKAKKAAKPKKKVAKKPKVLTPQQKDANKLKGLKKMALLDAPDHGKPSGWVVYLSETMGSHSGSFTDKIAEAKVSYANLSESQKQQLSRKAADRAEKESKDLAGYVASYPAEAIFMANRARARLNKTTSSRHKPLPDSRLPTHAPNGFARYVKEHLSNTPGGNSLPDRVRQVASDYKNLRDAEREKYDGPAKRDAQRTTELTKELREKGLKYWNNEGIAPTTVLSYGLVARTSSAG